MKIYIDIDVPDDWNDRLDMQWIVEGEVKADRWSWHRAIPSQQCDGCGKTGADGWALYCVRCSESVKQASVDFLPHDDHLRFIQRVLESDAPQTDRDAAAQMARDIRRSIRPQEKP
jgi:hypothetical protein